MQSVIKHTREKMQHSIEATEREFGSIRTGRATPALLDRIKVDYYGSEMPINQLGAISVPEPRQIVIAPWDKQTIAMIEKAIMASDLGITPTSDGNVVRLNIPYLTEERRREMIKQLHKKAEDHRVAIRNIRRDVNDKLKHQEKASEISEDDSRRTQDQVQKLTDKYIEEIDRLQKHKEAELLEV